MIKKEFFLIVGILFCISLVSSAHYITGFVDDALDGENADNHVVVMWNPSVGIQDNLTDIIGVNGNAGFQGVYLMDCELLDSPCSIDDELRLRVVDSGDNYVSNYSSVIVSSFGYDMVDNMTINSIPVVSINSPANHNITNINPVAINCSFDDMDSGGTLSLYGNFSGSWSVFDSLYVSSGNHIFNVPLSEGSYSYYCKGDDGLVMKNTSVRNIIVDRTVPSINSFLLNNTYFCGESTLRIGCDTDDEYGISDVLMEIYSPFGVSNVSATNISLSNYVYDVSINQSGDWDFYCYSIDNAGNIERSSLKSISAYSGNPELSLGETYITFSDESPMEGQNILISANVSNFGCLDANDFFVSFYLGDPLSSGTLIDEVSVNISAFSNDVLSVSYDSMIGSNDIFVYVDSYGILGEDNESNNIYDSVLSVPSWQVFYGNISAVKILSGNTDINTWENYTQVSGNVFMADSESNIDWLSLLAIGKNKFGENSTDDLFDIDVSLGMENYSDSVETIYSDGYFSDFFVRKTNVTDVYSINSTDNINFRTGILWDSSDSVDDEYDSSEKEDIVFVSNINKAATGKYGIYDYEINIPAKLREYNSADVSDVYFYYELI